MVRLADRGVAHRQERPGRRQAGEAARGGHTQPVAGGAAPSAPFGGGCLPGGDGTEDRAACPGTAASLSELGGAGPNGVVAAGLLRVPAWAAKNRKERVVGLTPEALSVLDVAWTALQVRNREATRTTRLFPSMHKRAFDRARRATGYTESITLRDLRHCHATYATQGTGDAAAAQAALGHADLRTTQRYLTATLSRAAGAAAAVGDLLAGREAEASVDDLGSIRQQLEALTAALGQAGALGRSGALSGAPLGDSGISPAKCRE